MIAEEQPTWVCADCGERWASGGARTHWSAWHRDICGVCGEETACTEPRDYGYLKPGWEPEFGPALTYEEVAPLISAHIKELLGE